MKKTMNIRFVILTMSLFFVVGFFSHAYAQEQSDKVKAVFLFKFFDYTAWPSDKDPKYTKNGIICLLGEHSFGDMLTYIAKKKSGKISYKIQEIVRPQEANDCHIIYFSRDNFYHVQSLSRVNALMVADDPNFIEQGGVIEVLDEGDRMNIRIHLGHVKEQKLKISLRLLKIAEVIG